VTASQDLDKPTPPAPRRRLRLFRRPASAPGADDARALAAANRRIVHLEMELAARQRRLDRLAGQYAPPCWHDARLRAAEVENMRLQIEHAEDYAHMRGLLEQARAANGDLPARDDEPGGGR
jgi:hypothetical protein